MGEKSVTDEEKEEQITEADLDTDVSGRYGTRCSESKTGASAHASSTGTHRRETTPGRSLDLLLPQTPGEARKGSSSPDRDPVVLPLRVAAYRLAVLHK